MSPGGEPREFRDCRAGPARQAGHEEALTGRRYDINGYPIKMTEILAELTGTTYVARAAVDSPKNLMKAKKVLRGAFEAQIKHEGFGFVEFLSACPTNWKMTAQEAHKRIAEEVVPYFQLGVLKGE